MDIFIIALANIIVGTLVGLSLIHIYVITWSIGIITLVESSLPPNPTSITPKSISSFLKYKSIKTVR